jgi:hypothetical protein
MGNIYPNAVRMGILYIVWHAFRLAGAQRYGYDEDGQPLHFNEVFDKMKLCPVAHADGLIDRVGVADMLICALE